MTTGNACPECGVGMDDNYALHDVCLDCHEIESAVEEIIEYLRKYSPALIIVSDLAVEEIERGLKSVLRQRFMS